MTESVSEHNNRVMAEFISAQAPENTRKKWVLWAFHEIKISNFNGYRINPDWLMKSPNITGYEMAILTPNKTVWEEEPFWHQSQSDQWNSEEGVGTK